MAVVLPFRSSAHGVAVQLPPQQGQEAFRGPLGPGYLFPATCVFYFVSEKSNIRSKAAKDYSGPDVPFL
jgi:hypothetical protein